jgi:hypothetical protein
MNKYKVKITHVFSEILDIEAFNEDEARGKAKARIVEDSYQSNPQYETTLPVEHWPVITEDKYNEMVEKFKEEMAKKEEPSNIITP